MRLYYHYRYVYFSFQFELLVRPSQTLHLTVVAVAGKAVVVDNREKVEILSVMPVISRRKQVEAEAVAFEVVVEKKREAKLLTRVV